MQKIFYTEHSVAEFSQRNEALFPEAPDRCPHTGCQAYVKQKKHGFYARNIISFEFVGRIIIRRYICPVCDRTISMLPMFCLPHYQYSLLTIFLVLYEYYSKNKSLVRISREQQETYPAMKRRHIRLYKQRFEANRPLIEYGINNISPEGNLWRGQPEIYQWAKEILSGMHKTPPSIFNIQFHQETGKSFMAHIKMIA